LSAGVRENAADKKPHPVNENETPSTAAQMRALAEQAEAEAAEAEALAAAARARARAIQLRRQAELVEATEKEEPHAAERAESETEDTSCEGEPADASPASVETEESAGDAVVEPDADIEAGAASHVAADKPAWYRRWRRPGLSTTAAILAVMVIIAALAGSVYMVLEHRKASHRRELAAEFAAAARQGVVTLTSLDFNNAKEGVQRIIDDSTGSFKDDFAKMAGDFTKVVEQSKVVERGTVQAVGVDLDSMTNDSAVVLVASTSEVTNAAGAKQDPRTFRLIVSLARDGDQLKMSKVEFVP
jgi:Mce-associated membrane protein